MGGIRCLILTSCSLLVLTGFCACSATCTEQQVGATVIRDHSNLPLPTTAAGTINSSVPQYQLEFTSESTAVLTLPHPDGTVRIEYSVERDGQISVEKRHAL